jgi:hypothetical protein
MQTRTKRIVLILCGIFVLGGGGFAWLGYTLFCPESASNRASAINCTLAWGRLAPFLQSAQQFHISVGGTLFTRRFRASFVAPPPDIEQWLQQSPGPREATLTTPSPGVRHFEITPGEGAMHAEVIVDDVRHCVSIYVYWS